MSRGGPGAALAIAVALGATGPAAHAIEIGRDAGRPITLDFTESFFFHYHTRLDDPQATDPHEDIFDLRNRLTLRFKWNDLSAGVRLDAAWFPNAPTGRYKNDVRPEELFVAYRLGGLRLTLGDDFVSFGRGLALTLRKFDDLGFEVSLRGVHVRWRSKLLRAQLGVGITNVVNVDEVEEKRIDDPNDLVLGARVEVKPLKWLRAGVHVSAVERRNSSVFQALAPVIPGDTEDTFVQQSQKYVRSLIYGGNVELTNVAKALSVYAEVDALTNTNKRRTARGDVEETDHGLAVYSAVTGYLDELTLLGEFKHYDKYRLGPTVPLDAEQETTYEQLTYITPPSLERIDQRVENNEDVTGVHLRADYGIPDTKETLFLSGAYFWDAPEDTNTTLHTYAGWEHRAANGRDRWQLQAGYRLESAPDADPSRTLLTMVHVDFDLFLFLGGVHDLQYHLTHEFRSKEPDLSADLSDDYVEGTTYLSWNIAPSWSFTAQLEYLSDKEHEDDPLFPGGFVMYRIDKSSWVRLFAGKNKGGLKCTGGVCRIFPDFEGVKLDATIRF